MLEPLAFFSHIPKTAGTTLLEIIRSQYRRSEVVQLYGMSSADHEAAIANFPAKVRMIAAHQPLSLRDRLPAPCHTITLLRDPIELLISLFSYAQQSSTHSLHSAITVGKIDLVGLARKERIRQMAWLAGELKPTGRSDEELLAMARENLHSTDVTFGITEAFPESLVLFSRALGWRVSAYFPQNVTRTRLKKTQLRPSELGEIEEILGADIAFYEYARERFEERVRAEPMAFQEELAKLNTRSRAARWAAAIRRRLGNIRG